ncbi:hypothetical protein D3C86_2241060 [compost metagenome]
MFIVNEHYLDGSTNDSTGKSIVVNGNGICGFYDKDFKEIIESGAIKDGVYDGVWRGGWKKMELLAI